MIKNVDGLFPEKYCSTVLKIVQGVPHAARGFGYHFCPAFKAGGDAFSNLRDNPQISEASISSVCAPFTDGQTFDGSLAIGLCRHSGTLGISSICVPVAGLATAVFEYSASFGMRF